MALSKKKPTMAKEISPDRQWEVRDAMMTLQRAEQIKQDRSLMGAVKKEVVNLGKVVNKSSIRRK